MSFTQFSFVVSNATSHYPDLESTLELVGFIRSSTVPQLFLPNQHSEVLPGSTRFYQLTWFGNCTSFLDLISAIAVPASRLPQRPPQVDHHQGSGAALPSVRARADVRWAPGCWNMTCFHIFFPIDVISVYKCHIFIDKKTYSMM